MALCVLLTGLALSHDTATCGGNLTALSGTIQSPNFPGNYPNYTSCVFVITAPPKYRITLTFLSFDVEYSGSCSYDYVEIRDGPRLTSQRLDRLCGSSIPSPRRSFGNQMRVQLYTDESFGRPGFNATYTSAPDSDSFLLITSSGPGWPGSGDITRMDTKTVTNYVIPMSSSLHNPIAVDYDSLEEKIYWTEVSSDFNGIRSAFLNGSDVQYIRNASTAGILDGIAIDPVSRLIVYTNAGIPAIAIVSLKTFAHKTVIHSGLDKPRAIVLDITSGMMFWTDWGASAKIERANYDGTERTPVISDNTLVYVNGLALDVKNDKLYWVDAATDLVEMSDMRGQNRQTLQSLGAAHGFFGITLIDNVLFVTDWIKNESQSIGSLLHRFPLDRSINTTSFRSTNRLNDIHAHYLERPVESEFNGCSNNNGGCTDICIPRPNNRSGCLCPDSYKLSSDNVSCVSECGGVLTALNGSFQSPGYPGNYTIDLDCVFIITGPEHHRITLNFTAIDIEIEQNCGYDYVEVRDGNNASSPILGRFCGSTIPTARRTFGNQMYIKFHSDSTFNRKGFAAVYTTATHEDAFLLVTSSDSGYAGNIILMDTETSSHYTIAFSSRLYNPIAVDYDPVEKMVYWTEYSALFNGTRRAFLNGSGVETVSNSGPNSELSGLAVDPQNRILFYTDAGNKAIVMMTMPGFARRTIISNNLDKPRAIVLDTFDGVMFWTDWGSDAKIERANYHGDGRTTIVTNTLQYINALALDKSNQYLYWVDASTDRVERSDLYGAGRVILLELSSPHHFFGLAIFKDTLYITDWMDDDSGSVDSYLLQLPLGQQGNISYFRRGAYSRLNDIHAYSDSSTLMVPNGCSNNNKGGCSHFCIPLPSNRMECLCPDDQVLTTDLKTCVHGPNWITSASPAAFVIVQALSAQPFEADGSRQMMLFCDTTVPADVVSYNWSIDCAQRTRHTCSFAPRPDVDNGKYVKCIVMLADRREVEGGITIRLTALSQYSTLTGLSESSTMTHSPEGQPEAHKSSSSSNSSAVGGALGGILAVVIIIAIILLVAVFVMRRRIRKQEESQLSDISTRQNPYNNLREENYAVQEVSIPEAQFQGPNRGSKADTGYSNPAYDQLGASGGEMGQGGLALKPIS